MAERFINLVVPLPHEGTAMRNEETDRRCAERSSAVSPLIGEGLQQSDVDSTILPAGRGTRTSTTATRTTTNRTTVSAPEPSADRGPVSFAELVEAYFDCRRTKRNSNAALSFEMRLERNLRRLYDELADGSYTPGRSKCFVITRPKPREVWAAAFRDRIVHHLLYNRIGPRFERSFIADSFEFFRTDRGNDPNKLYINRSYWCEKLQAVDCNGYGKGDAKRFDAEKFEARVKEHVESYLEGRDVSDERRAALMQEIQDDVLDYISDGNGYEAFNRLNEFHADDFPRLFEDCWEWNCDEYTFHFIWNLYAIAWAIRTYDAARAATEAA